MSLASHPESTANNPSAPAPAGPGQAVIEDGDSLAAIRHSLRTPLNQIIGYCELMLEESADIDDPDLLGDLRKIHTAGGQLLSLINDALAPWKLETGTIDLDVLRLEMRTPLNLIIGYSELCQEVAEDNNRNRLIADLQKITGAAKNLLALFESVSFPAQLQIKKSALSPAFPDKISTGDASAGPRREGNILIVDDNEMNRDMLCRRLERQGYTVAEAENGVQALEILKTRQFDLMLLDVVMPEMGGFETLKRVKADPAVRHVPVIMLSALDEIDNVIRCVEIGADDYVTKPFNPVLLNARISASLDKKRLRDQERNYLGQLEMERQKNETLLRNLLPPAIAERLKQGESLIADQFPSASVLIADIHDFNQAASQLTPTETVELLNDIVSQFDWLAELHGLEKIKTVVDKYIAAAGVPVAQGNHAAAVAEMALEMQKVIKRMGGLARLNFRLRIGIGSGPVVGGVIGRKKFLYDIWGDAVKIAGLLEESCEPGSIRVSEATFELLRDKYTFKDAEPIELKRKGSLKTHLLIGRGLRPAPPAGFA